MPRPFSPATFTFTMKVINIRLLIDHKWLTVQLVYKTSTEVAILLIPKQELYQSTTTSVQFFLFYCSEHCVLSKYIPFFIEPLIPQGCLKNFLTLPPPAEVLKRGLTLSKVSKGKRDGNLNADNPPFPRESVLHRYQHQHLWVASPTRCGTGYRRQLLGNRSQRQGADHTGRDSQPVALHRCSCGRFCSLSLEGWEILEPGSFHLQAARNISVVLVLVSPVPSIHIEGSQLSLIKISSVGRIK